MEFWLVHLAVCQVALSSQKNYETEPGRGRAIGSRVATREGQREPIAQKNPFAMGSVAKVQAGFAQNLGMEYPADSGTNRNRNGILSTLKPLHSKADGDAVGALGYPY